MVQKCRIQKNPISNMVQKRRIGGTQEGEMMERWRICRGGEAPAGRRRRPAAQYRSWGRPWHKKGEEGGKLEFRKGR